MSRFTFCNCPAGFNADPERHAPDCPGRSGAGKARTPVPATIKPAEQHQGEYPPCDYCGTVPDYHPWHGSGLLNGVENRHIHACDQCRGLLPMHPGQHQGEPNVFDALTILFGKKNVEHEPSAPDCVTCNDEGAVGNILDTVPCPDCAAAPPVERDGWIPVNERKPEYDKVVLVAFDNHEGKNYTTAHLTNQKRCADPRSTEHDEVWYVHVSGGHRLKTVTHWCEIDRASLERKP